MYCLHIYTDIIHVYIKKKSLGEVKEEGKNFWLWLIVYSRNKNISIWTQCYITVYFDNKYNHDMTFSIHLSTSESSIHIRKALLLPNLLQYLIVLFIVEKWGDLLFIQTAFIYPELRKKFFSAKLMGIQTLELIPLLNV